MVIRIDVASNSNVENAEGAAVRHAAKDLGFDTGTVDVSRVYLIDCDGDPEAARTAAETLLADPIVERAVDTSSRKSRVEVHLKPGVMDPVAASAEMALRDAGTPVKAVRTGRAFVFEKALPREKLEALAARALANGVIESVHFDAYRPTEFSRGADHGNELRHVALLDKTPEQLKALSREAHLFLSPAEMAAVQDYFKARGSDPTDVELETIAQTWSEHCVHKTLKSKVEVEERDSAGNVVSTRSYGNLIKETIFASTMELMKTDGGFCLSVFKDNAGVIAFDEDDAVCFKVETHNHPSAIEPYGGSATGIGGCIRDVMGTGRAAKPIANTDVFCVADPNFAATLPNGVIHPKRVLQQVVAGVRDYGNRMGIPTVNGGVVFDDRYIGNPLVFCGCAGMIPRNKIDKAARPGDAIVVMGGRTGRDGIHGATFSSAELTDTHADEFSHAVQIGNAITQKKVLDVLLQARDRELFTAVTDCGAGGLSSAVGEMGEKLGADVDLATVPLKYAGLRYDEIWISEAQERMVLSVPQERVHELLALAQSEDVEATVIGTFGTKDAELILRLGDREVGHLSMHFLHDGIPMPTRKAAVSSANPQSTINDQQSTEDFPTKLLTTLALPNIASKHWIIRQYDHEVQGGSVIKPLVGRDQIGPSDAAVVRPKGDSLRGVVLSNGLATGIADPYAMAVASIDEAVRNAVAVGANPAKLALLDNFCWPSVDDEITMGTLVRACEACRDVALAFGTPFISGKDSLHNQFTDSATGIVTRIPPTLLISAIGVIDDVRNCATMDFKSAGASVLLVRAKSQTDLALLVATHRTIAAQISAGNVAACHDVSDGGYACAVAEMCIASGIGIIVDAALFREGVAFESANGGYVVELNPSSNLQSFVASFDGAADVVKLGVTSPSRQLTLKPTVGQTTHILIDDMTAAWRGTLDW